MQDASGKANSKNVIPIKVSELRPLQKKIDIVVKVEDKAQERQVTTQSDGKFHRVCEALAGDESGCILLPLWDEHVDIVQKGRYYKITNAYTSMYRGSIRLCAGKYGTISPVEGKFEVNTSNNLSLKEVP